MNDGKGGFNTSLTGSKALCICPWCLDECNILNIFVKIKKMPSWFSLWYEII